jgi:O-antigen/teichoic acid export membrane protein
LLFKSKGIDAFSFYIEWSVIKRMLGLGSIYALNIFVILLNFRVDIILLDYLSSPFEVGIYSKGMGITEYLWQIPMLFSHVVMQRSAISTDDRAFSLKITQLLRLSLIVIGAASLVLGLLSKFIIVGMYGEAFSGSVSVLIILLPGILLLTFYKVMSTDLAGKGKPWITLKAMTLALPINLILNWYLIPNYGANGAAISSTISYSFAAFLFLHYYSKEVNISIKTILNFQKSDFIPVINLLEKLKK